MLEVLGQDYVRTARAKGLGGVSVVVRHALKNALIPVITIFGLQFGNLLAGAVIVETVFSRPGLGRLIVDGILSKDFPLVQGTVLFVATSTCSSTSWSTSPTRTPTRASGSAERMPGTASLARRLVRHRGALVGLVILGALALMALTAPWLSPRDPIKTAPRAALQPPGATYWLGSDRSAATWPAACCTAPASRSRWV